jgi:phosphoribosylformimino-5-aminoimidazole carboxamide ribotide isomerase
MDIIPAIDLQNGHCVRLTQGAFDTSTIYNAEPMAQAQIFARQGATWLHVVDLDGARAGAPRQFGLIAEIAQAAGLKVQVGGGIRDDRAVGQLFDAGIARIVVGSLAVNDPQRVIEWIRTFGPTRIVPAFDIKFDPTGAPEILTHGWQSCSGQSLWQVLDGYADSGLTTVLCTDIGRDGMLQGPNLDLYAAMGRRWPTLDLLASGGVADAGDLEKLAALGVAGVVVGKAIYEGRIDLAATLGAAHAR